MERQLQKPAASVFSPLPTALVLAGSMLLAACGGDDDNDGPILQPVDRVAEGQNVFRFETFGNEVFWTDAMQLP